MSRYEAGCHQLCRVPAVTWHSNVWTPHCGAYLPRARVGPWWSAPLVEGAGACLGVPAPRRGSSGLGVAVRGTGGSCALSRASGWLVCTGSGGARAAALGLRALSSGGRGSGTPAAGLDAPWEATRAYFVHTLWWRPFAPQHQNKADARAPVLAFAPCRLLVFQVRLGTAGVGPLGETHNRILGHYRSGKQRL